MEESDPIACLNAGDEYVRQLTNIVIDIIWKEGFYVDTWGHNEAEGRLEDGGEWEQEI